MTNRETAELPQLLGEAAFLQEDFDQGLAFFDENGRLKSASGSGDLWQGLEKELSPLVIGLAQGGRSDQLTVYTENDPQTGEALVVILAVDQPGQRVTAGATSATALAQRVLGGEQTGDHQAAFLLVDGDRRPVYDTGFSLAEGLPADHPGVVEALGGESGTTYLNEGENEHVVAYSPGGLVGWGLISEEPWEMVTTPILRTTQDATLVLVPALILALVALWNTDAD